MDTAPGRGLTAPGLAEQFTERFTHLHVASSYSLRYGTADPGALADRAAELGMPALALTDRDGLYGAFKHAQACDRAGIKPLLGADLALSGPCPRNQTGPCPRNQTGPGPRNQDRVTLLAVGRTGWASLCRLVSAAHTAADGPQVTHEQIADHADGLVVLLGPGSDVGRAVAARRPGLAREKLRRWHAYCEIAVEIVDHLEAGGAAEPASTARAARMAGLAASEHVPAVLTNAVRYLDPADSMAAQVLDAARHLVPLGSPKLQPHNGRAYLAGPGDMAAVAERVGAPWLLRATAELAARCELDPKKDLGIGRRHLPEGEAPGREQAVLRARCEQAAGNRRRDRLDHELDIIARTGMASYFLTVADIADRIKRTGIRCAIRGSGAGSLVNYLLGISAIDPLEHGLLMERFLSLVRNTLPDIDLDVESARRLEAYRVIFDAYGEDRTATVSMMETYRARSAIRDVAAAMSLPPDETDRIAKAFPHIRAKNITSALAELPELKDSRIGESRLGLLFRVAQQLDGLPRHVAMHPCGILLSDKTLKDRTATQTSREGFPLSHLDKDDAEIAGVIKLDVLGVRMQSAMAHTLTEIKRTTQTDIDLDAIPRDDEPTFEMIRQSRTLGCFQIESPGQRELVKKLAPRDVADLIVDISLFRPGPVNSDMITPFLRTRHGLAVPRYPHEDLKDALAETGGVVIFHEQVLRIIDAMTGCGLSEADLVRRALSGPDGLERTAVWFRARAVKNGYDIETVERVWEVVAAFGGFGFCKAHAAAFAVPVYQSAWLKRHYPAAFYAGVLTHDPGMYPKRVITGDARLSGVEVLPVDVNASAGEWKVEHPKSSSRTDHPSCDAIRVSLREVKGMSDAEVARIIAGQPYESLRDFTERAGASRPVTENLVLSGAFDSLYPSHPTSPTRRDLLARVGVLDRGKKRNAAGPALFSVSDMLAVPSGTHRGDGGPGVSPGNALWVDPEGVVPPGDRASAEDGMEAVVPAGQLRDLDPAERVAAELDILGFDVTRHVLDFYRELLDDLRVVRSPDLGKCRPGETILVAGVKVTTQTPAVRSGQRVIFATLDDAAGLVDLTFFESVQDRCASRLFGSSLLLVRGRVRRAGAGPTATSVNATECWDLPALEEIRRAGGSPAVEVRLFQRNPLRQGSVLLVRHSLL